MVCHGPGGFKGYNIDVSTALIMQGGTTKQPSASGMNWGMVIGGLFATAGNVAATLIAAKKGVAANPASTSVFNTRCFQTGNFAGGTSDAAQMTSLFCGLAQQGVSLYQQSRTQPQFQLFQNGVTQQKATTTQKGTDTSKLKTKYERSDINGDGKVTVDEAWKEIDFASYVKEASRGNTNGETYKKMSAMTSSLRQALEAAAGDDGLLTNEEYDKFIAGKEWHDFLNTWHTSKGAEEFFVENEGTAVFEKGNLPADDVKRDIEARLSWGIECSQEEKEKLYSLIDKFAGDDGTFTKEEFDQFRATPEFIAWKNKFND